jgi:hypothetical protein
MERTDSERLAVISERSAVIESTLLDVKRQLFGNGQPGQIQLLHSRVSTVDKRVDLLENWKWWVVGAGVGAGTALGYILRVLGEL